MIQSPKIEATSAGLAAGECFLKAFDCTKEWTALSLTVCQLVNEETPGALPTTSSFLKGKAQSSIKGTKLFFKATKAIIIIINDFEGKATLNWHENEKKYHHV